MTWVPRPPNLSDKVADWECLSLVGGEELIRGKVVADVGAEWGVDALMFCKYASTYFAFDNSEQCLEHLRKILPYPAIVRNVDLCQAWPFDDCRLDTILDFSAFDDSEDPLACYAHAARVLRVGGTLVTSYANARVIRAETPFATQDPDALSMYLSTLGLSVHRRLRDNEPRAFIAAFKREHIMNIPTDRERAFWKIASGFSHEKEKVYPEHTGAQEFDSAAGKLVFEYGCGGGSDTLSYLRRGAHVTYADIVPGNIQTTSNRIVAAGFVGAVPCPLHASNHIPLGSNQFDIVSSHGVLHHIRDPNSVVDELFRILKSGGKIYVMLYTEKLREEADAQVGRWVAEKGLSPEEAFAWFTDGGPNGGPPYAVPYREEDGWGLLERAGFTRLDTYMSNGNRFRTFRATKP